MSDIQIFMTGLIVALSFIAGLQFLKFYRLSHDRFFVWFAGAFWVFAVGWTIRVFDENAGEHAHLVFLPRLIGFVMILIAILDKNRRAAK